MRTYTPAALLAAALAGPAGADTGHADTRNPDGAAGVRFFNAEQSLEGHEVNPPGGFFFSFRHGPDSTFGVYRTAAGVGRSLPIRINRHNEEHGYVVRGSVLFKAGYDGEFERVLRAGDVIIIPECVPHSGIFGWDANEETLLLTTFVDKYHEYGPDTAQEVSPEFAAKIRYAADAAPAEIDRCKQQDSPPITWTVDDLRKRLPPGAAQP